MSATLTQERGAEKPPAVRRTILAASLVFPALFFPVGNEVVGTLLAFGTFAVGFVARPVGGVLFGHIGDRIGPKRIRWRPQWARSAPW